MAVSRIKELASGVNQRGLRDYNERLLLSALLRFGPTPGSELARMTGLSPQTVSIILRNLESENFIMRGDPVKGRVGKPSVPMALCPDGAFSFGLKIGRQSADLLLLDLVGTVRAQETISYVRPTPKQIFKFIERAMAKFTASLQIEHQTRICGIGIGAPFELWAKADERNLAAEQLDPWANIDIAAEVARFSTLPVFVVNDATAACRAEHIYGRGKEFGDYAYFFIGSRIGGGIVLSDSVYEGNQGNAGALGSIPSTGHQGESRQLVDVASLNLLERRLIEAGVDPAKLGESSDDWSSLSRYVDPWIGQVAQELAKAALSVCSVIDFEAILIDGAFPAAIREELVERVGRYVVNQDVRGLIPPRIEIGSIGQNARAIGAASSPIFSQLFLDAKAGLSASS